MSNPMQFVLGILAGMVELPILIIFFLSMSMIPVWNYSMVTKMFSIELPQSLFLMLTLWIFMVMVLAINNQVLWGYLLFLTEMLILSFLVSNFFSFYLFFEGSLIPTLIIIMLWGYQPERSGAGMYMMIYTVLSSFTVLMMFFFLKGSSFYFSSSTSWNMWNYLLVIPFLVKIPMYGLHLWLPKAHVEAPLVGSMILASVLLKLGGYGLYRLLGFIKIFPYEMVIWSLLGGLMISMLCLRQTDLKALIAFSSVCHMSLVVVSFSFLSFLTLRGMMLVMIAHGLTSPGIFVLASIMYEVYGSRSMIMIKGLLSSIPLMSMMWFLMVLCNLSGPPSLNLISEITVFSYGSSMGMVIVVIFIWLIFFSGAYSLFMYSSVNHGSYFSEAKISMMNVVLILFHLLPSILLFLKMVF